MHKVTGFRDFANAIRALAESEPVGANRDNLLSVAEDWAAMARRRELLLLPQTLWGMVRGFPQRPINRDGAQVFDLELPWRRPKQD